METLRAQQASILSVSRVLAKLDSDQGAGLSKQEVESRRTKLGWNEFSIGSPEPLWRKYLDQFKNPLILLLLGSAGVSVLMGQFDDALSITLAIVIVVTVAFVQEYRSERSLEALNRLVPPKCHCLRGGQVAEVLARELVPGDIVCVSLGDRFPADMRIIEAADLQVNESSFTGETMPALKSARIPDDEQDDQLKLSNIAFMGTFVVSGRGLGVVICPAGESEFGSVFQMMEAMETPKTPLQKDMDTLGKQLSIYSMAIIGVIMLVGWLKGESLLSMFTIGVSLAVAAIPEGLPIVVTVTLALGVMRMASRNAIVKKLPIVETLGCVTVVCSDKTGTLTENELTVTELYTTNGTHAVVTKESVRVGEQEVVAGSHLDVSQVVEVGCVCSNAQLKEGGGFCGHPLDIALFRLAQKCGLAFTRDVYLKEGEVPFNSERKWMSVTVRAKSPQHTGFSGAGSVVMVKGALDHVLPMCPEVSPRVVAAAQSWAQAMGRKGLRVLAVCRGSEAGRLELLGVVGMVDPPREGVRGAIQYLQQTGVEVKVITGDSQDTAVSIAEQLGIWNGHSVSGSQLEAEIAEQAKVTILQSSVFYRVAPKHKINIVKALQESQHIVAMTGDGTNDAIALKGADIGVAMGMSGTDVCREASDMILTDDNFLTIVSAIKEGKGIFYNIRNFVRFQLSTSIAALSLIAVSTVMGLPNPLNAMQILWINIIMDGPPAQSLGVEPVAAWVESQPPRKTKESIITRSLVLQTCQSALIILLGTLWVFWREMTFDNQVTPRDTTMTFTCFVFFDMFNAFSCRSLRESSLRLGLFSNQAFVYATVGSLVGQLLVVYLPPLQAVFDTEALSLGDLLGLAALASTVLIADELRKMATAGGLAAWLRYTGGGPQHTPAVQPSSGEV